MKILKKKKLSYPVYMEEGDTLSVVWNDNPLINYSHKGKKIEINWVAIFIYKGGYCGGFFAKEPK